MTKLPATIVSLNRREAKLRVGFRVQITLMIEDHGKINKLSPCSSSMYFSLDPESAYEASLQRVQENKTNILL